MRTQLGRASPGTRLKKILRALLAVGLVAGFFAIGGGWVSYVCFAFSALCLVAMIRYAIIGQVAPCPSCRAPLGAASDGTELLEVSDEPMTLRCAKCGEYLTLLRGEVQLHAPEISEQPTFKSRAFEDGVWPEACVLCGDQPTRHESLGKLKGVPYCGAHSRALQLRVVDDQLELTWRSLPMLRKYLAANRRAG